MVQLLESIRATMTNLHSEVTELRSPVGDKKKPKQNSVGDLY